MYRKVKATPTVKSNRVVSTESNEPEDGAGLWMYLGPCEPKGTGIIDEKVNATVKAYTEGTKGIGLEEAEEIIAATKTREELPWPEKWHREMAEVNGRSRFGAL